MHLLGVEFSAKIRKTDEFVRSMLGIGIEDFILQEYCDNPNKSVFLSIVKDDFDQESINLIQERMAKMGQFRDRRTDQQYACDLLLGWIVEDTMSKKIVDLGYRCVKSSADKDRDFIRRPQATADLAVTDENGSFPLEIMQDFGTYWEVQGCVDLRESKYVKMKKEGVAVLGIEIVGRKFFLEWIDDFADVREFNNPRWRGKKAYKIDLTGIEKHDIDDIGNVLARFSSERCRRAA